ncbi:ABC-three component system middle component 6 [Litoribacter populi]|uniref:ABC-three component system middle component 6 n=1 Tax=Litoribacter populi TaxID=2598460 RepID=UPI00117F5623|nr:ABC-three component system middle component 6 [Litoribacter populi]
MILSKEVKPDRKLYFTGALVLETLREEVENTVEYLDLYLKVKARKNMSLQSFILTLDWLYILGAVKNENGKLKKCL